MEPYQFTLLMIGFSILCVILIVLVSLGVFWLMESGKAKACWKAITALKRPISGFGFWR